MAELFDSVALRAADLLGSPDTLLSRADIATNPLLHRVGRDLAAQLPLAQQTAFPVTRGAGGPRIAYVQASTASVHVSRFVRRFTFTDGTVWLVGQQLDAALAADAFIGAAFSTAELVVPTGFMPHPQGPFDPTMPAGTPIVVPFDVTAILTLQPVQGTPAAGSVVDDGANATIAAPGSVAFDLAPEGARLTELGDASATLYGSAITLTGGLAGTTSDAGRSEWVAGFVTASGTLDCSAPASSVFVTAGSAPISGGNWRLPIRNTTADQLGAAAPSTLDFAGGAGLTARWGSEPISRTLDAVHVVVGTGQFRLTAAFTADRPVTDTYRLWDTGSTERPATSSISVRIPSAATVTSAQSTTVDVVQVSGCSIEAHLDRPVLADGSQPRVDRLVVDYLLGTNATGEYLILIGSGPPSPDSPEAYLLRNALLRTDGVIELVLLAQRTADQATDVTLVLASTLTNLTPTLPDPYAAQLGTFEQPLRTLLAGVLWKAPAPPEVAFDILASSPFGGRPVPPSGRRFDLPTVTLYDVSGALDQFGVVITEQALLSAEVDKQMLTVSGQASALFALPQIAWEAVITEDLPGDRAIFGALAGNDGPSTTVNVATQALRPMAPDAFIEQFLADYSAGSDLQAHFTLPFGLEADVFTGATDPPSRAPRPTLQSEAPTFGSETGGTQLSIAAPVSLYQRQILPGRSFTTTDAGDPGYPPAILDPDAASFWDQEFSAGINGSPFVPVERIGLSGYGSSTFSDYVDNTIPVGVSEARFDVIVGRTSYALVQIRSLLCPWKVLVVKTIIFERDAAGWIQRRSTGWRAKSPGTFAFDGGPSAELGPVTQITNIRNIVELDLPHVQAAGKDWVQVSFDTDVSLVTGGSDGLRLSGGDIGGGRVAGTRFTGWIDLTVSATPPSLGDVIGLMDVVQAASGTVSGEVLAGGDSASDVPGVALTLTGVDVQATDNAGPRALGVALRGIPHLPRDGSWSVARRSATQQTPRPVDPLTPVPLVRFSGDTATWHLAEPSDVLSLASPATLYSFVQSTGTQQLLFEHPTITGGAGQNPLNFRQTPALADVGALLGSSGLLPALGSMLKFPSFTGFVPSGDGLATTQTLTHTTQLGDTTLIPLGPISVVMATNLDPTLQPAPPAPAQQSVITVSIDPGADPRWAITITNVAFKLIVDGMSSSTDPLVAVIGDVVAADGKPPTVTNLQFAYGNSLSVVKDVLSGIEAIAEALPGGNASGLDVGFTGTKLRIRDAVSLPQLPLGLGYLQGISLNLGVDVDVLAKTMTFAVGVGSDQNYLIAGWARPEL
ncbi:MAG: hypothetical protein ABI775_06005, partial [Pseudonocardiales bacterium]